MDRNLIFFSDDKIKIDFFFRASTIDTLIHILLPATATK